MMTSLLVAASTIVCCHIIPSLFVIFIPLPFIYLPILFMEVTIFTYRTSIWLVKGCGWRPIAPTTETAH